MNFKAPVNLLASGVCIQHSLQMQTPDFLNVVGSEPQNHLIIASNPRGKY